MSIRSLLSRRDTRVTSKGGAARAGRRASHPVQLITLPPEALEPRVLLAFFAVTTTDDAGPGSLRQAMLDANANPQGDVIAFSVPAGSTIRPLSPLPPLTGMTLFRAGTTAPTVEIDGSAAGPTADGLVFGAGATGSRIDGLAINRFGASGIVTAAPASPTAGFAGLVLKNTY